MITDSDRPPTPPSRVKRMPSLTALRAFEAVGRTGSVRAAADELLINPTVISRHVHGLQKDFGRRLIQPNGRGLRLTEAGLRLHQQLRQAFDLIRRAMESVDESPRTRLILWCIPGFATRALLPKLPLLRQRINPVEVTLHPTLSRPNFAHDSADAEIVYLSEPPCAADLRAERLSTPRMVPVAGPGFAGGVSKFRVAADLAGTVLIHEESTRQWAEWLRQAGVDPIPELRGPHLFQAQLAIEAARLGQGVALAPLPIVEDDLRAGRLVEIVPSDVQLGSYYLIAPAEKWLDPTIVELRRWLTRLLAGQ